MGKRKLTPGPWGMEADNFEQLKDLLIRWLKPVPSSRFHEMSRKLEDDWNEQFWENKTYSDRWGKTRFLNEIRCAGSVGKIGEIFSWIDNGLNPIGIFLCSKLSASNAEITVPLIACLDVEDGYVEDQLCCLKENYKLIVEHGLKNVCTVDCGYVEKRGLKMFEKVSKEMRLDSFECTDFVARFLEVYSPRLEPGWSDSAEGRECTRKQHERDVEVGSRHWRLPESVIPPDLLTKKQKALLRRIEAETGVQVILWRNEDQSFFGVLSYPPLSLDEKITANAAGQPRPEYGRLCYVAEEPSSIANYPASVLHEFEILNKNEDTKQWLSSECSGKSIEAVLKMMGDYTQLLNNGWTLKNSVQLFLNSPAFRCL